MPYTYDVSITLVRRKAGELRITRKDIKGIDKKG